MTARSYVGWGEPQAPDWQGPREPLGLRLPPRLVQEIRERARDQGVSISVAAQRLIEAGLGARSPGAVSHHDLVTTLFD